jgi:hypothetical protein
MPNCRAIAEGLTPALKAARTAFSLPVVKPTPCSVGAWRGCGLASAVGLPFARLGGSRPRRAASVVTAASKASISALSSRFGAPARSWGKKWRGCESRLPALAFLFGTARGSGALAVGGAENRSGVVSAERWVGMMPTMPPASDRGNGLAEMGPASRTTERAESSPPATAPRTGFRPTSRRDQYRGFGRDPRIVGRQQWPVQQQAHREIPRRPQLIHRDLISCGLIARGWVISWRLLLPERSCGLLGLIKLPGGRPTSDGALPTGVVVVERSRTTTPERRGPILTAPTRQPRLQPWPCLCR